MVLDKLGRPLATLRLSVTDRCNLRCTYCMPEANYRWLEKPHLLTFEELTRLVGLLTAQGLSRVRVTGGEPLLRQNLPTLISMLSRAGVPDLAMTSNGVLLARAAQALHKSGLQRLTVSLDTLQRDRFKQLTQRDELPSVLDGLQVAAQTGFQELKIDSVLMRAINDSEIIDLVRYAGQLGAEIRFIEYMDVGGATRWQAHQVVTQAEVLEILNQAFGPVEALPGRGSAPAQRFRLNNGQIVGIVASVTHPFCADCDRLRLTADGQLLTCLYARTGLDIRESLRDGQSDQDISQRIQRYWGRRTDQSAVERTQLSTRSSYISLSELRANPRLEMHTRGG